MDLAHCLRSPAQDLNDGDVRWKLDDPKALMKEVEDKRVAAEEAGRQKREKQLKKARDEIDKAKSTMAPPSELFRGDKTRAAAYSRFAKRHSNVRRIRDINTCQVRRKRDPNPRQGRRRLNQTL